MTDQCRRRRTRKCAARILNRAADCLLSSFQSCKDTSSKCSWIRLDYLCLDVRVRCCFIFPRAHPLESWRALYLLLSIISSTAECRLSLSQSHRTTHMLQTLDTTFCLCLLYAPRACCCFDPPRPAAPTRVRCCLALPRSSPLTPYAPNAVDRLGAGVSLLRRVFFLVIGGFLARRRLASRRCAISCSWSCPGYRTE